MRKKMLAVLLAAAMTLSLAACGGTASSTAPADTSADAAADAAEEEEAAPTEAPAEEEEAPAEAPAGESETDEVYVAEEPLRVAGLKGPTTMGLVNLIADSANGEEVGSLEFSMYGAADEIVPLLVKGDLDAAAIPANLAATLYQKTEGAVEIACVNTLGVLYVLELGDNIHSVEDLKGATIVSTGKGTTPEYVLRYVLQENGIDPDTDVTIEYLSEASEVASKLTEATASGQTIVAMLPQPYVTSVVAQSEGGVRVALDMTEEWQKVAGSQLVTGVLLVRKDAVEADPERFAQFLSDYAASVESAESELEATAALCEEYGIVGKAALAQKALPACNIVFETGEEMKDDVGAYLQVLYDADPASVGGALPDDDFYYEAG